MRFSAGLAKLDCYFTVDQAVALARSDFEDHLASRILGCPMCGTVFMKFGYRKFCTKRCQQKYSSIHHSKKKARMLKEHQVRLDAEDALANGAGD